MKVIKWLDEHFEEFFLVVFLALISIVELVQVIIRNVPWIPALTWAEEFCRFMWIWSVFMSLPFTIRKSSMLRVNVVIDLLPQVVRKIINILVDLITGTAMSIMLYHSVGVIEKIKLSGETSPAMAWPMWLVYSFMFIGFALGVIRSIEMVIIHIRDFNVKEKSTTEKTMEEAAEEAKAGKRAEGAEETAEGGIA